MTLLRDALSAVLILAGSAFCLLAALGLLRFPDTLTRLHAATKAQSAGLLLTLAGGALRTPREPPRRCSSSPCSSC